MKAFLIDPFSKQVNEISLILNNESYLDSIIKHLECSWFQDLFTCDTGDHIYVDEVGLLNRKTLAFYVLDCPVPIFGKAIVVGNENGEISPPILTQQIIENSVRFLNKEQTELYRNERTKNHTTIPYPGNLN